MAKPWKVKRVVSTYTGNTQIHISKTFSNIHMIFHGLVVSCLASPYVDWSSIIGDSLLMLRNQNRTHIWLVMMNAILLFHTSMHHFLNASQWPTTVTDREWLAIIMAFWNSHIGSDPSHRDDKTQLRSRACAQVDRPYTSILSLPIRKPRTPFSHTHLQKALSVQDHLNEWLSDNY